MESPQRPPRTRLPPLPHHITQLHSGRGDPSGCVVSGGSRSPPLAPPLAPPPPQVGAPDLRRLLTRLQRGSPGDVSSLVTVLVQFLSGALRSFDPEWWRDLLDVLILLRPLRECLAGERSRLLPSLELLHRQYERHRPLLCHLDLPGALRNAFPPDTSTLFRLPEDLEQRYGAPHPPVYVQDLALYVGDVGAELANMETVWRCGRKDLSRALRTDLPLSLQPRTHPMTDPRIPEVPQQHQAPRKGLGATGAVVSGYDAAEILVKYRHVGKVIFLYLNRAGGLLDCFYDLRVTTVSRLNPEHFVFSPFGILHVTPGGGSEGAELGVWHREAVLCRTLRNIPFYRDFQKRRPFRWWQRNVRRIRFLRRREMLSRRLLRGVPHYTAALQHINRFLQELALLPFLSSLISNPISLDELEAEQCRLRSESSRHLCGLLGLTGRILEMVRRDTFLMVQKGQEDALHCLEEATRGRLQHMESWLLRLGSLSCLVGHMICQNLMSILQLNVSTFVCGVIQMRTMTGRPLLHVSLEYGEDGDLRLNPSAVRIQQRVDRMVDAALNSVLKVIDSSDWDPSSQSAMTPHPTEHGSPVYSVLGEQSLRQVLPAPVLPPGKCKEILMPGGLRVDGHQQWAHYLPLNIKSLKDMLHHDRSIQEEQRRLQKLLQDSLSEVQAFCEDQAWLSDVHRYVQSWSPHVLEKLRGSPARDYEDLILKVQLWEQRVHSLKDHVTTAMVEVGCGPIHTQTGPGLAAILQDILVLLTSEVADTSRSLVLELSLALEIFRGVSAEISSFSKCADKVAEYKMKKHELEERVEHVRSLHEVIRMNYRQQTAEEQKVNSKLTETWDTFQHFLKVSAEFLSSHLSSMSGSLENSYRVTYKEAEDLIVASTAAPYRDPSQNVALMLRDLGALHHKLSSCLSQLRDLSHSRQILYGKGFDFSVVSVGMQMVQARQESWKLMSRCREQISAWKLRPLIKVNIGRMREKLQLLEQSLGGLTQILPGGDPLLQSVQDCLQDFTRHLPLLQSLLDPAVTHRHWAAIFAVIGKNYGGPETLTLMELLSGPLLREEEQIHKILLQARAEFSVHQDFGKIQRFWQEREFHLVRFFLCVSREDPPPDPARRPTSGKFRKLAKGCSTQDTGTFLLADTRSLCSLIEDSLLSLHTIRSSNYSAGQRDEILGWIQKLRNLGRVLNLLVTFQGKWVFLTKVESEMDVCLPGPEMVTEFQSLDLSFRSFLEVTKHDPLVLSILNPSRRRDWNFYGDSLCSALQRGIRVMEDIILTLGDVLDSARCDFPRLFFLSDEDVMDVLAASTEPSDRLPCALLCFPYCTDVLFRIQSPKSSDFPLIGSHVTVGVRGNYGDTLYFSSPITWSPRVVSWLIELEWAVRQSLKEQLSICLTEGRQSCLHRSARHEDLRRWLERGMSHHLQCLMVTEEVVWCEDVERLILTDQRAQLRDWHNLKVDILVQRLRQVESRRPEHGQSILQERAFLFKWISQAVLQRNRTSDLLNTGIQTLDSFSWAKLMKYRAPAHAADTLENAKDLSPAEEPVLPSSPLCFVDVLGHVLPYGHEYVGLDMKSMDSAISERTSLGLILTLGRYQCGAVIGQDEGLRTQTLLALGRALGRQVVVLKCWSGLNVGRLTLHLKGALQCGAWLVLDHADRLNTGVLASLGQLLGEVQASYEALMKSTEFHIEKRSELVGEIQMEGRTLVVRRHYGCFMTLPHMDSSLALPCSLRLLLRPVSFCPPDLCYTAELALLSAGFQEPFHLAKKLSSFLHLARESGAVSAASALPLLRNIIQKAIVLLRSDGKAIRWPMDPDQCQPPQSSMMEETSLVTALLTSSLWSGHSGPEDSHLTDLLRGVFPASISPLPRSLGAVLLSGAVQLHLHESGLEGHTELSNNVMWLFQALQQSSGVLLTGPSGGGKTTCWRALQQALNHLAANEVGTNPEVTTSPVYRPVHSVHLFPNSLSRAELLGLGPDGDSVFSRMLHQTESTVQKWIILDGSAALSWLEPISCLFGPQSALTLPGGQQLHLSEGNKLLFEMPDTSSLSPAMSTLCSFVYCGGQETWRAIVKAFLSSMYIRYHITRSTQHKLETLSDHLIPRTLCFLKEHGTSALHPHSATPSPRACGAHQVSSFCSILQSLMDQHLLRNQSHRAPEQAELIAEGPQTTTPGSEDGTPSSTDVLTLQDQCVPPDNHRQAQTFFLYAFTWAFGGPLHPRHSSEFDVFLRKSLVDCVLQVGIPQDVSVFDVTPTPDGLGLTANPGASQTQGDGLLYAARCLALSGRPLLLVGAPGSGKTTLAQSLVPAGATTTRIPFNSMLKATCLQQVLKTHQDAPVPIEPTRVRAPRGRHLFILDDLHAADSESGAQPALEVVRHILSSHTSGAQSSFLATTSPPEDGCGSLCPRLSRLFCVLVMRPAGPEVLLSLFGPRFTVWLKKSIPVQQPKEFSEALAEASISLFYQVTKALPSKYCFSLHHLHRMLQSMTFLCPSPGAHLPAMPISSMSAADLTRCGIVRLWLHEVFRTFGDGLETHEENAVFRDLLRSCVMRTFSRHHTLENTSDGAGTIEQPPSNGEGRPENEGQTIGAEMETIMITNQDARTEPDVKSCDQSPKKFPLPPELLLGDIDLQHLSFLHDYSHGSHVRSDSYREKPSKALTMVQTHHNLTLSPEDCDHLAHLTRILHLPKGHIVLRSQHPGTGRRSLARLAAQLTQCTLLELRGEETAEERHAIIREACWMAGVQGSSAALLIGEGTPQQELEALICEGTFPGLHTSEQEEAILQTMLQINEKSSYKSASKKSLRERYNMQVRNNLHIISLLRIGAPDLRRVTFTDLYHPWSITSLQQVAENFLDRSSIRGPQPSSISRVMSFIHLLAQSYCHRLWPRLPLTSPGAFISFIQIYLKVSSELQDSIDQEEERLRRAVSRVERIHDVRQHYTKEMEENSQHLQEVEQKKNQWIKEFENLEEEEKRVKEESEELEAAKEKVRAQVCKLQGHRGRQLEEARLQWAAVQKDLTILDVEEIRSYRAPPPPVIMVTDVLCKVFGKESGWENAKLLIGQENFYQDLQFYDGHKMSDSVFASLTRAVHRPEFSVHLVRPVSMAAVSLCQWLLGLQRYCSILRTLEKGKALLYEVEAEDLQIAKRMAGQRLREAELRALKAQTSQNLQEAQETEQNVQNHLHELRSKHAAAQEYERRAQPHLTTWRAALGVTGGQQTLQGCLQSLQTDAMLVSASITYLGAIPWPRCTTLLTKWWSVCHGREVPIDPGDVREALGGADQDRSVLGHLLELLSSPAERMAWLKERLPVNTETLTRASLLRASGFYSEIRPTLILDPDVRVERWLPVLMHGKDSPQHHGDNHRQSPREGTPKLCVIDGSEVEITQRLSSAAGQGLCVLITNVEKKPSCLETVRSLQQGSPLHPVSSSRSQDPPSCSVRTPFHLFLSTSLPLSSFVKEVGASFLKDVTVVDLSLGSSGLEEELLQEVVLLKDSRLQEERWSLSWNAVELKKELWGTQDRLLDYVSSGSSPLVEDQDFLQEVTSCEEAQASLRSSLLDVEALQQRIQEDITPYMSASRGCFHLYSRLQEVSRLSPHYHFPASSVLCWALCALRSQIQSRQDLEKVLTNGILTRVLPMMAEEHRHVLHVLLAVGAPSPLEWFSFLGLKSFLEASSSCIQRPQWVDTQAWEELGRLEKISSFQGIRSSLSAKTQQWREYFGLRSTVIGPVPCSTFSHLTLFQVAILWRILKPECLGLVLSHLTSCILGPEAKGEEGADIVDRADPRTPLLFVLPLDSPLLPIDFIRLMAKKRGKKVRILSWRETPPPCSITDALLTARQEGQWLLLDRHPGLVDLVETGEADERNPPRLFVGATEEAVYSVPVSLRHSSLLPPCAVRLSLRDVLLQSCLDVAEDVGEPDPLTLRLLILHSILLLRQEYGTYIQRRTYCWSNQDLRDTLHVTRTVRTQCQDWDEALPFIIGAVIYRGHITDKEDGQSVMAVVQHCLQEPHEKSGRGLSHMMSALVASGVCGPWGHGVTRSLQKLLSMRDPAILGLSEGLKSMTMEIFGYQLLSNLLITQDIWTLRPGPDENHGASLGKGSWSRRGIPAESPGGPRLAVVEDAVSQCMDLLQELEEEQKRAQHELDGGHQGPGVAPQVPPADRKSKLRPLLSFLFGEWQLLHSLLQMTTQEVKDAASSCLCGRCQEIRKVLGEGQVPHWWNVYATSSLITLQAWIQGLHLRIRLLSSYISQASPYSVTYNISVFQKPSRFLHSLLQERALEDHRELEPYRLRVQVSGKTSSTLQPEGVSLVGIHLRHALWDTRQDLLQETLSLQLCALPVVHISAAPESSATPCHHPALSQYLCPLYMGTDSRGHMPESPVLFLPLPTNISPLVWSQRRVHALSLL
ncbi:dynein heavy chain domain-containing protein 1 isoform X2 [Hyla sarda]|uniref:dynein heavy chain domain-containing protein 1 isoform X2 n=1 Tax=Hyla sarda TaxID=327740 RepID=UPI0024C2C9B0|nr:dynein heavy chain domain-containing protein 1 isoform X2 [Hyla sarda]